MVNQAVWILDQSKGSLFSVNGVSGTFMVPRADFNIEPENIASARMWIILRGGEDRLFKSIRIKKIERIVDGYYTSDFILTADVMQSFAIAKTYPAAASFRLSETEHFKYGVSPIDADMVKVFQRTLSKAIKIKLTPPPDRVLRDIFIDPVPRNSRQLAVAAIKAAVSNFSLDDVWANGLGYKLGPFANFAERLLINQFSKPLNTQTIDFLRSFDPAMNLLNADISYISSARKEKADRSPSVDIEFTIIDPQTIRAREFVAGVDPRDLVAELKKTEHAEKTHQAMLKDIAEFLITSGVIPYESDSIDLMYGLNNRTVIFEIKSANKKNVLAQSAHGAFQLAFYTNEMNSSYENVDSFLILQSVGNPELERFLEKTLERLNTRVLFYDSEKDWPNKIGGLPLI